MRVFSLLWDMRHPIAFANSQIRTPLRLFTNKIFESYRAKTNEKIVSLREILFKAGVIALTTSVVVWLSVFLYVAFYYSYMPNVTHSRPVHLQFKSCDEQKGICSFPSAHVQLTRKQQLLMVGQPYRLRLTLDMPESEVNKQLGMFMCCAELRARGGLLVSAACRTGMLPYRSPLLRLAILMAYSPLYVTGIREERSRVELELFTQYEDDQTHPVTDVYVEIQSRHVELYSVMLFIEAHFSGLRYIMFHWPMLSAVVGISTNLLFVAFVCALSWYHLQAVDPAEEEARRADFDSEIFGGGTENYLFESEELAESLSIKEDTKDEDSHTSDISSLRESPLLTEDIKPPTQGKMKLEQ